MKVLQEKMGNRVVETYLTDNGLDQGYVTEEWDVHARKTI